jgi:hypothetical protein
MNTIRKISGSFVGRALDKLQNFALRHGSFRIGGCHRVREFDDLRLSLLRFEDFEVYCRTFAPQPPQSFIHGDSGKPRRKRGIAAKGPCDSRSGIL